MSTALWTHYGNIEFPRHFQRHVQVQSLHAAAQRR